MKLVDITAASGKKIKIDILMSQENNDGIFEAKENNFIILENGQTFIGLVDNKI
jgi:hypothetical protein